MTLRRTFRLTVEGWSRTRAAFIEGETLMMEVGREACRHCPTCSSRIRAVELRLRDTGADWHWVPGPDSGLYLAVPAPKEPDRVGSYLTMLLGLAVAVID